MSEAITRKPEPYSISVEELRHGPKHMEDSYDGTTAPSRDNFMAFVAESFNVSQGQPEAQRVMWEWLELKFGFNYKLTFSEFDSRLDGETDMWGEMTEEERQYFINRFLAVTKHLKAQGLRKSNDPIPQEKLATYISKIKRDFNSMNRMCDNGLKNLDRIKREIDINKIETFSELKKQIATYIQKKRAERATVTK